MQVAQATFTKNFFIFIVRIAIYISYLQFQVNANWSYVSYFSYVVAVVATVYLYWFYGICSLSVFNKISTETSNTPATKATTEWEESNSKYNICSIPERFVLFPKVPETPVSLQMK